MMNSYWQTLTARERTLVSAAVTLLAVTLVYFLAIRPLGIYQAESERTYRAALDQFQAVQSYANQLQAADRKAGGPALPQRPENLRTAVSNAARRSGVVISRLQPSEDGTLTIWAEQVQSPQLFLWLDTLSRTHAVSPSNVLIQKTSTPGNLRVQLQFSDPSS